MVTQRPPKIGSPAAPTDKTTARRDILKPGALADAFAPSSQLEISQLSAQGSGQVAGTAFESEQLTETNSMGERIKKKDKKEIGLIDGIAISSSGLRSVFEGLAKLFSSADNSITDRLEQLIVGDGTSKIMTVRIPNSPIPHVVFYDEKGPYALPGLGARVALNIDTTTSTDNAVALPAIFDANNINMANRGREYEALVSAYTRTAQSGSKGQTPARNISELGNTYAQAATEGQPLPIDTPAPIPAKSFAANFDTDEPGTDADENKIISPALDNEGLA